ncbi:MAG: 30S ribosomal protein S24e [Methanomicrobiales archaeon]|nr:30S ribosomal protein S24e [Methanomicrobiales archaeon]
MEITILEDKRNELLKRREIQFQVAYQGPTPSRQQVLDKLSALLNLSPNLTVIDSLRTRFGKTEIKGTARIYDTEEMKTEIERPYLFKRGKKAEAAPEKA